MFNEALQPNFKDYAHKVVENSIEMAKLFTERGYRVVSGGTDNHLLVLDLTNKNISGRDAEVALDLAAINANRNTIPFETKSPFVTSGIRLGTAALTTQAWEKLKSNLL